MMKFSVVLAMIGLAFLLLSVVPAPAAIPIALAPPATIAPTEAPDFAYGEALFSAKGCVACHHHAAIAGSGTFSEGNPDLSTAHWSADYLRAWLQNPVAVKPATSMPNLGLKRDEIEALIAFLGSSK